MKPPASYFGSKARLAPWITSLFPDHRVYVEPFAGSAAVLFAKRRSTHEIINDVDDGVVTFLRVLRDRPEDLERACRLTPYSRTEYEAAEPDSAVDDLERARLWWVRSSQSFGQVAKRNTGWSVTIQRGSNNARSVYNRLDRFAPAAERLAGVTIENRSALKVIDHYDDRNGVIYCDPPYLGTSRSMGNATRRTGDYLHDMYLPDEHRELAAALRSCSATVFLSGYASELYDDELFPDWHRVERRVLRRTSNGRSAAQPHAVEVLWANRPIVDVAQGDLFAEATTIADAVPDVRKVAAAALLDPEGDPT